MMTSLQERKKEEGEGAMGISGSKGGVSQEMEEMDVVVSESSSQQQQTMNSPSLVGVRKRRLNEEEERGQRRTTIAVPEEEEGSPERRSKHHDVNVKRKEETGAAAAAGVASSSSATSNESRSSSRIDSIPSPPSSSSSSTADGQGGGSLPLSSPPPPSPSPFSPSPSSYTSKSQEEGNPSHPPSSSSSSSSSWVFAAGPRMRVERVYNPTTLEHRCLVYRHDRHTPIAKLIWTRCGEGEDDVGVAHVKNVFVHESMRGSGLGRLLFYQLFATLRRVGVGLLRLEAEEDLTRHNRLITFYRSLGFHQTENARILYLNNYDEYFRKVPMYREISPSILSSPEFDEHASFMVVVLRSFGGGTIYGEEGGRVGVDVSGQGSSSSSSSNNSRRRSSRSNMMTSSASSSSSATTINSTKRSSPRQQKGGISSSITSGTPITTRDSNGSNSSPIPITTTTASLPPTNSTDTSKATKGTSNKNHHERIWVLVQDAAGGVAMLENNVGRFLCAEPGGKVVADRAMLSTWEVFELEPYEVGSKTASMSPTSSSTSSSSSSSTSREVFAFRTFHGKYLRIANNATEDDLITTAEEPTLWEVAQQGVGGPKVIEVVSDPERHRRRAYREGKQASVRAIHRKMRRINSVRFVKAMNEKWTTHYGSLVVEPPSAPSSFSPYQLQQQKGKAISIRRAVELLQTHLDPLLPDVSNRRVAYGETLLWIAESIRAKGHPDWMQLLGILHGLGRLVFVLLQTDHDLCDWAFGGQSWVVGCRIPFTIRYPDVNELNEDWEVPEYSTECGIYLPHCGLDQVMLNWSGSEYMYHLLKMQNHSLPPEALAIVRYLDLDMWHSGTQYDHLTNNEDDAMKEWVTNFYRLRAEAIASIPCPSSNSSTSNSNNSGNNRNTLINLEHVWPYYQELVDKYLPDGPMLW